MFASVLASSSDGFSACLYVFDHCHSARGDKEIIRDLGSFTLPNGFVTLPNRARSNSAGTSGSRRGGDFTPCLPADARKVGAFLLNVRWRGREVLWGAARTRRALVQTAEAGIFAANWPWSKRTHMLSMDDLFTGRHFDREILGEHRRGKRTKIRSRNISTI